LSTAATAAGLAAILVGAGAATYQAGVAKRERARADRRFEDVRRVANSFLFEFHDAIADLPGTLGARQLVVKRAAEYLDGLAREAEGDVALQRELATAYQRLGDILGGGGVANLGDQNGARTQYQHALAIRQALAARAGAQPADFDGLAELRVMLSRFFILTGDYEAAETSAQDAVLLLESPRVVQDRTVRHGGHLATAYHQLGYAQARRGENAAALVSLEQAVRRATAAVAGGTGAAIDVARLARLEIDYASQLNEADRFGESIAVLQDARRRLNEVLSRDRLNKRYRQYLQMALNNEADSLQGLGNDDAAVRTYTDAAGIADALLSDDPKDQGLQIGAMESYYALGAGLVHVKDGAAAANWFRRAISEAETILKSSPDNIYMANQLAAVRLEFGETMLATKSGMSEGCREIQQGWDMWDALARRGQLSAEGEKRRGSRFEDLRTRCAGVR